MKIKSITCRNYRTLEDIDITFTDYYTALCGRNNSGKSNIIRVIQMLLSFETRFDFKDYDGNDWEFDITAWKKKTKTDNAIFIKIVIELHTEEDASIFKFIKELILKDDSNIDPVANSHLLEIELENKQNQQEANYKIKFSDIEITDDYKRNELLSKIKGSRLILFHNSTEYSEFPSLRRRDDYVSNYFEKEDLDVISKKKEVLVKAVQKSLKKHQEELGNLLGRLEEKYEVNLTIPNISLERETLEISLKERGVDVSLDEWGSGTRNRTLIFMHLMRAKRLQSSGNLKERSTPILLIEEPESFLHPSAQSEFGRILQSLANELKIQVIVTTHSPYLLSHKNPQSNILLERKKSLKRKPLATYIVNTSGEKWYEPFALALGMNTDDLGPLKNAIFSSANEIILVEGEIDKEYLELLMREEHKSNKINFNGEIFPYGGADNLKNNILLKFIKGRFSRFIVTVDRDKYHDVKKSFEIVGLQEDVHYIIVGKNESGKKCIEGLLPKTILSKVWSDNPELVQKAMENSSDKKEAQNLLKLKLLEVFKRESEPGDEHYSDFYKLSNKINKILKKPLNDEPEAIE